MTLSWSRCDTDWHAWIGKVRVGIIVRGADSLYYVAADACVNGRFTTLADAKAAFVGALEAVS